MPLNSQRRCAWSALDVCRTCSGTRASDCMLPLQAFRATTLGMSTSKWRRKQRAADVFAGCGASARCMRMAGYAITLLVERDPYCRKVCLPTLGSPPADMPPQASSLDLPYFLIGCSMQRHATGPNRLSVVMRAQLLRQHFPEAELRMELDAKAENELQVPVTAVESGRSFQVLSSCMLQCTPRV